MSVVKKTQLTIRIPDALMERVDSLINQCRFRSRSDLFKHVLENWLEQERDDELWEMAKKHEEDPSQFGCDTGFGSFLDER